MATTPTGVPAQDKFPAADGGPGAIPSGSTQPAEAAGGASRSTETPGTLTDGPRSAGADAGENADRADPRLTNPRRTDPRRTDPRPQDDSSVDQKVRPRLAIRSGGMLDLTFDDLEFPIERDAPFERSMLSEQIEAFVGQRVVLRGFILASSVFQQRGIKQFILVRDNQECCFGPGAYLYHNVQIDMVESESANFSIRPVSVEGTLSIKPYVLDDVCYSVYHILASKVTY